MYLPWSEIEPAFQRLISLSLRYPPVTDPLTPARTWPDFLSRHADVITSANPAKTLARLMSDDNLRARWLFNLFLPKEHGNEFYRYPAQREYLRLWLTKRRSRGNQQIICCDTACGSGEGTWDLASLCHECGFMADNVTISGSSIDPLELFAAAHAVFPQDVSRERRYRLRIAPLLALGFGSRLAFFQDDLTASDKEDKQQRYDLIICNGLLGGPLLHESAQMHRVITTLLPRLRSGGLFLAADRFHAGWSKRTPKKAREHLLSQCGLNIVELAEGIGGEIIT